MNFYYQNLTLSSQRKPLSSIWQTKRMKKGKATCLELENLIEECSKKSRSLLIMNLTKRRNKLRQVLSIYWLKKEELIEKVWYMRVMIRIHRIVDLRPERCPNINSLKLSMSLTRRFFLKSLTLPQMRDLNPELEIALKMRINIITVVFIIQSKKVFMLFLCLTLRKLSLRLVKEHQFQASFSLSYFSYRLIWEDQRESWNLMKI
jgi:hypothetical protein